MGKFYPHMSIVLVFGFHSQAHMLLRLWLVPSQRQSRLVKQADLSSLELFCARLPPLLSVYVCAPDLTFITVLSVSIDGYFSLCSIICATAVWAYFQQL